MDITFGHPGLLELAIKPTLCVMYKYMAILHTACIVVSAVHDKKYLLLVLYSLDSYHKRPGYSAVVSLAGGTQQNTTRLQNRSVPLH